MTTGAVRSMKTKRRISHAVLYVVLIAVGITMLIPFLWMIMGSLMSEADILQANWSLSGPWYFSNYRQVIERIPFFTFYANTAKIAVVSTVIQLLICSLAAYAFARLEFRGRDLIFMLYLSTMMIPSQVTMIPQYVLMGKLKLLNSHTALIILRATSVFGIFMLRQFFLSLPQELSESARIDGCGELRIFTQIIMPLSKAAIATLTVFSFLGAWNDFMTPLIYLTTKSKFTLQIGIRYFQQMYGTEFTLIMAATTMSLIPIVVLYLFCQRYFIAGIATTGIKG